LANTKAYRSFADGHFQNSAEIFRRPILTFRAGFDEKYIRLIPPPASICFRPITVQCPFSGSETTQQEA
jgi:hypothetical protein